MQPLNRREQLQALLAATMLALLGFALYHGGSAALVSLAGAAGAGWLAFGNPRTATTPQALLERISGVAGHELDRAEEWLCAQIGAEKKGDRTIVGVAFNFALVMAVVLPADLLFQHMTSAENSLLLYQRFLTWFVWAVESAFGVAVSIGGSNGTLLLYDDMIDLEIVSACTGLHETLFLGLLILCFRGVQPMVRVRWAAYAAIFIFFENALRIITAYPLIMQYGFATWDKVHYFWWQTGQYALIMALFMLWVMTIGGRPENRSRARPT